PFAVGKRQQVLRAGLTVVGAAGGDSGGCVGGSLHVRTIARMQPGSGEFARFVKSMQMRETLLDLRAAAMTMHVAESAHIHQHIKAKTLPGAEWAQQLVMLAAMPQADID